MVVKGLDGQLVAAACIYGMCRNQGSCQRVITLTLYEETIGEQSALWQADCLHRVTKHLNWFWWCPRIPWRLER